MYDLSGVAFGIVALGTFFLAARKVLRIWHVNRDRDPECKIAARALLGALVAGGAVKLMLILLLLVLQFPLRKATSYLQQIGFWGGDIAALMNNALPLLALFLLIDFLNALPKPDEREKQ